MISDENEELNRKSCDKTDDFNRLKREYDGEKMMQVMRERQKAKGLVYPKRKNKKHDDKFSYGKLKKDVI